MELEFDKEMDAILRKAGSGVRAKGAVAGGHIDADAIAAFAENALPQATKRAYISHFADCDNCRTRLSRAMSMTEPAVEGASVVTTATAATPWYARLFRTPGLAFAMGALILTFSGVLAFLVVQNRDSGNAIISQQTENRSPVEGILSPGAAANTTANIARAASNSNVSAATPDATPGERQKAEGEKSADALAKESMPTREEKGYLSDGVSGGEPSKPAAPPESVTTDVTIGEIDNKDEDKAEREQPRDDDAVLKRKMDSRRRDAPPAASKSGPSRAGPMQNQNQINSNAGEMSVTRSVGGKKFNNRDGVWYDTSYRGQATLDFHRSSTDYKSLDSGLRSIANELGGTVVVVWKGKAYRIN